MLAVALMPSNATHLSDRQLKAAKATDEAFIRMNVGDVGKPNLIGLHDIKLALKHWVRRPLAYHRAF